MYRPARYVGTVKFFDISKNFGFIFIQLADGEVAEVFFHRGEIPGTVPATNELVEFELAPNLRRPGFLARNVTLKAQGDS